MNSKKIKPTFPNKVSLLICTFDKPIAEHINRRSYCYFFNMKYLPLYDLTFCKDKEVWIFCLQDKACEKLINFGFSLLRNGAAKVHIQSFPLGGCSYE